MVKFYAKWVNDYPIFRSKTDSPRTTGCWQTLTKELGSKIQLVGDDIFSHIQIFARASKRDRQLHL